MESLERRVKALEEKLKAPKTKGFAAFLNQNAQLLVVLGTIITAIIGAWVSIASLTAQKEAELQLEKEKNRNAIIQKAIEVSNGDETELRNSLVFFNAIGLIDLKNILDSVKVARDTGTVDSFYFTVPLPVANSTSGWLVIVSADNTKDQANYEKKKVVDLKYNALLHKKGKYWVTTAGPFLTKQQAFEVQSILKEKINSTAYIVNYDNWCIDPLETDSCILCKLNGKYY